MADIIELEKRRQHSKSEEAEALREEKIQVLKRILHCSRCSLKCSRCGTQVQEDDERPKAKAPYPFCSGCQDEYEDYLRRSRGETSEEKYWHNETWMEVWRTWLGHQRALDDYRRSSEFIRLLHEFESLC